MDDQLRFKLVLGKYRVIRIQPVPDGHAMVLDLGNSVKMTVIVPPIADVREGDLLTLYTEVLTCPPSQTTNPTNTPNS